MVPPPSPTGPLASYPDVASWDHWEEYEAKAWPRREKKTYALVPTICFNCEAACGLLAYVDKETGRSEVRGQPDASGEPRHGSARRARRRSTRSTIRSASSIRCSGRASAARASGSSVTWDEALDEIAGRIRKALHRGAPQRGHVPRRDGPAMRARSSACCEAWGIDGHNSHTNICSSSARLGYQLWTGSDRPSPDHANARFILLLSSHLETGHYFNPHAQRIIEGEDGRREARGHGPAALATRRAWPTTGCRRGPGPKPPSCSPWPGSCCATSSTTASSCGAGSTGRSTCAPRFPDAPVDFDLFIEKSAHPLREVHAGVRGGGERRPRGHDRGGRARHRGRRLRLRGPRLARRGLRATSAAGRSRARCSS